MEKEYEKGWREREEVSEREREVSEREKMCARVCRE